MIRWLKGLLIAVTCLLVLLGAGLLAIWERPSIVINPRTLVWAQRYAPKLGYELKWDSVKVEATSPSFWVKGLSLDFTGLSVKAADGSLDGRFGKAEARVIADLAGFKLRLTEAGPVTILGGRLSLDPNRSLPKPDSKGSSSAAGQGFFPEWMASAHMNSIRIELDHWSLSMEEGTDASGSLKLKNLEGKKGWSWDAKVRERMTGSAAHWARIELKAETGLQQDWINPKNARARAIGRFADGRRAEALLDVRRGRGEDELIYEVAGNWFDHGRLAVLKTHGKLSPNAISGELDATARRYNSFVPKLALQGCAYSFSRVADDRNQGDLKFDCPMAAAIDFPPVPGLPSLKVPTESHAKLQANLRTSFPPSGDKPVKGDVRLDLGPMFTPLAEGSGTIVAQLDGIPVQFPEKWKLDTDVNVKLSVPKFESVVTELHTTRWAIPAPFNILVGNAEFGASGKVDLNRAKLPLYLRTRLLSKYQRVDIDGTGELVLENLIHKNKQGVFQFLVDLSDVQLALPRLSSTELPPRLVPDPRIVSFLKASKAALDEAAASFRYNVHVKTPGATPVRLTSNLAKSPVPVSLDLGFESGREMAGSVSIGGFPVEFFRRKAVVERFLVRFNPIDGRRILDGSIRVDYTDYTIRILVFGEADSPKIKLISDPPVAEDQLIAVLLFGKPLQELDPEQTESIGQTRSAIANQAVGLGSMFLLASTPIESVNFDPETRSFGAKVKLGSGTSLNVGQDQDAHGHVGVKKRLSRYWTITTDVARSTTTPSGSSASAFLEWSNRY